MRSGSPSGELIQKSFLHPPWPATTSFTHLHHVFRYLRPQSSQQFDFLQVAAVEDGFSYAVRRDLAQVQQLHILHAAQPGNGQEADISDWAER